MNRQERLRMIEKLSIRAETFFNKGLRPAGDWHLYQDRKGNIYDLSAADLTQIDRIIREGLFIVEEETTVEAES